MVCESFREHLIGRIYGEISPEDAAALERHLAGCETCRAEVGQLEGLRGDLREAEPIVPMGPRVLVLETKRLRRPAFAFAAGFALAASLCGIGILAGLRLASPAGPPGGTVETALTEQQIVDRIEQAVARRWPGEPRTATQGPVLQQPAGSLTREDLQALLADFRREVEGGRMHDMEYVLGEIRAAERRTGSRIGRTQQALRYVALASDPRVSEQ